MSRISRYSFLTFGLLCVLFGVFFFSHHGLWRFRLSRSGLLMLRDEDQMGGDTMSNHVIFLYLHFTSLCVLTLAVAVLGSALHSPGLCPPPPLCPLRLHSCLPPANRPGSAAERQRFGRGWRAKDCGRQTTSWKRNFYESVWEKTSDMIRRVEIVWK